MNGGYRGQPYYGGQQNYGGQPQYVKPAPQPAPAYQNYGTQQYGGLGGRA